MSCCECDVIFLYFLDLFILCVACMTVFVNCFMKQFALCLDVVAIFVECYGSV